MVVTESISHFLSIPGFFLDFRVFLNCLSAVNVSFSRAACCSSGRFVRETFAATAKLDNCCLSGQEVKCEPLQREAGSQDSHQRLHVPGDTERQKRVSFLQPTVYFSKRLQLLQLGVSLLLIRLVTCNPPTDLVMPHRPSFNLPLPPAC